MTDDLQERVAGDDAFRTVLKEAISVAYVQGCEGMIGVEMVVLDVIEAYAKPLAQAAIAECNRWLPIVDAEDCKVYLIARHIDGTTEWVRIAGLNVQKRPAIDKPFRIWVDEFGSHVAPYHGDSAPTHYCEITPPEASGAERRSDSDAE